MSEVAQSAQHDFWRPPATVEQIPTRSSSQSTNACAVCGTEFMVEAGFCHRCGTARAARLLDSGWMRYLEFQNIKQGLGLGTASLVAFLIGVGCVLAALSVGLIYSVQNFADFQAVQLWRMQWLLAGIASFVAGLLLKRKTPQEK